MTTTTTQRPTTSLCCAVPPSAMSAALHGQPPHRPYNTIVYDNENQPRKLPGYRVDAIVDASIRYIDEHQQQPFFLFISQLEPHQQNQQDYFPAPDGYEERYRGAWVPPDLAALGG